MSVRIASLSLTALLGAACLGAQTVSYTHLRAHETPEHLVCRLPPAKKKHTQSITQQHLYHYQSTYPFTKTNHTILPLIQTPLTTLHLSQHY